MSLELEIKALTVAVLELTNTIISGAKTVPPAAAAKDLLGRVAAKMVDSAGRAAPAPEPAPEKTKASPLTYEKDVRPVVIGLGGIAGGREAVRKILEQFNTDHATKVDPQHWPMFIAAVAEARRALEVK